MKNILAAVVLLAVVFFAPGCRRPLPPGDTLRVGLGAEPASLDPHLAQGLAEVRVLSSIYEGLVLPFENKNGDSISGGVANAWQIKDNGCKIIFHLRGDARWNNGQPIVAQDFVDSWQRALQPGLAAPNAALFDAIEGAKNFRSGKGAWSQVGVKAIGPRTLEVRLDEPAPNFLKTLTHPIFYPLYHAKQLPAQRGQAWIKPWTLVSNGAFRLVEQRPYEKLTVEKNKNYWAAERVSLRKIIFYPIDNRASEEMAFLSGALDITMALPLNKVEAYRRDPRLRMDPALQVGYLVVNTRRAPLNNLEVRRALSLALQRPDLCRQVLRGGQTPAYRFVPPNLAISYLSQEPAGTENCLHDDAPAQAAGSLHESAPEAQKILAALPAETRAAVGKIVLRFNTSEARKLISETLQAQWQKNLGLNITLENLEWKTFLSARQSGDFDLAQAGWSADFDDPANFLDLFVSDNPNNVTGWSNTEYDTAVRTRDFARAEEILLSELPCIPLYFNPNVYLIAPRVEGWVSSPMDLHDWRAVRLKNYPAK